MRCGLFVWLVVAAGCGRASDGGAPPDDPAARRVLVDRLQAALVRDGYTVEEGSFSVFRFEDCAGRANCFYVNPASPYVTYQFADGDAAPAASWHLGGDEAVVFIGKTPPPARYFGWRSYLYRRDGTDLFASLGDTLNQLVIATQGTPGGAPGDPFARDTVVITTADRALDAQLRAQLVEAGAPTAILNTDVIPSPLVRMGYDAGADTFLMLLRVAVFADAARGDAYLGAVPGVVLRVRPTAQKAADPFALPTLRPRGTGRTEADHAAALDRLGAAILARHAPLVAAASSAQPLDIWGWDCIQAGRPCSGDNRDTPYLRLGPTLLSADPSDFIVVYGVDHERTGKSSYANLSLYDAARGAAVLGLLGTDLHGSAADYLGDDPAATDLYAWRFARACGGAPYCSEVGQGFPGVPLDGNLSFLERAYLEPPTRAGPLPEELEAPRMLQFHAP
jgi:hypothetical protein